MFNDTQQAVQYPKLCLHAGGKVATLEEVRAVKTPTGTSTWAPLPYGALVDHVRTTVENTGYRVCSETHALAQEGARYFGIMAIQHVQPKQNAQAWDTILGIRNSHDKSCQISLAVGNRVFVCDNMSFHGDIKVGRRNTKYAERDIIPLLGEAFGRVVGMWGAQERRVKAYQEHELSDLQAHDLLVRVARGGGLPASRLIEAVEQWHKPAYPDFEPRNAWSLYNACTHVVKEGSFDTISARTQRCGAVVDAFCGVKLV